MIIIIGIISCQPDKPIEKIEFPVGEFIVKSNSDTTLFGKQGTRIFVGSETFQFPNGDLIKDSNMQKSSQKSRRRLSPPHPFSLS